MRNLLLTLMANVSLAAQAASPLAGLTAAVPVQAFAQADEDLVPYEITLNTAAPEAVVAKTKKKADFDAEILAPLRAAQEAKAREVAEKAKKRAKQPAVPVAEATGDAWAKLRLCEAGGIYTRNSGNGYYGAYQYNLGTWGNYGGYARPDLAPAEVQDAKARETHARRGWSPWPACSKKLGLR